MSNQSADVSALSGYARKYQKKLILTLLSALDIVNDIQVIPNVTDNIRLPKLTVAKGIRKFSSATEFKNNDIAFTDRTLTVSPGKREVRIEPEVYRQTYLANNLPFGNANNQQIPFAEDTWNRVIEMVNSEINDDTAFSGLDFDSLTIATYSEAATYSAGDYIAYTLNGNTEYYRCLTNTIAGEDPIDTPAKWEDVNALMITKGIGTLIAELITSSDITPQSIGALSTGSGAKGAFEEMYRSVPAQFKKRGTGIIQLCSYTDYELLLDGIEDISKYTGKDNATGDNPDWIYLPKSNRRCIVKPATWIGDSRRIIQTPSIMVNGEPKSANLYYGCDMLGDQNNIKTVEELWALQAGLKFLIGFQVGDLESIWVNDQA